ncbi:MAG TPA: ATP synthase F1 subunit delta [Clostridiales bacterium]|jgi:F-type H+-transporting ATPase subunit delta|nr:ATP synthase F1 subunit delta [Clostridiales bacterium]HCS10736.1 ATP synthase F1 subunit delta [Clostridiales bacterium]
MAKLKDRYANALLEISEEKGSLEKDLEQAVIVRNTLERDDVQAFLAHPHVPDSAKHQLFQNAFSDKLAKHIMGFLYLMVRKNREFLIVPALTEYIERTDRLFGRLEAKVVSAKALTEEQIESIRMILTRQINMEVKLKAKIDPDVIGGFYILVDGCIFDCTVRSELNIMREHLKRGIE